MAIPVTAEIRGFAGIHVPAKFHFFTGILYRDYTLNLVIKFKFFNKNLIKKKKNRIQAKSRNFSSHNKQ